MRVSTVVYRIKQGECMGRKVAGGGRKDRPTGRVISNRSLSASAAISAWLALFAVATLGTRSRKR